MAELANNNSSSHSNDLNQVPNQEEIQRLQENLIRHPETAPEQLSKYNITIGQGSEIHIGDRIYQSWDEESIRSLVAAIQEANKSTNGKIYQHLKNQPLETLRINSENIRKFNSDLEFAYNLERQGYLTTSQKDAFLDLKQEAHSLNQSLHQFDEKLESLLRAAKTLLEESRETLIQEIQSLQRRGQEVLDAKALEQVSKEQSCKTAELRILEEFIRELEDSEEIANWIDGTRKSIAKRFGREALKSFPEIEKNSDSDKISYFCFSIYQFLEQIAHCLKWGRKNILDDPGIPLVFDYSVYQEAFSLIKKMINENSPSRFDTVDRKRANEYIDYLIERLPFYENE